MPATPEQCRRYRKRLKQRVRELYGTKCQQCGKSGSLHLAHTRPNGISGMGRGQTVRFLSALRDPLGYLLLCPDCHRKRGGIDSHVPLNWMME